MQSEIKRWGNSAAVRLPSKLLALARLDVSSQVNIEVREGRIVIEATEKKGKRLKLPFSEEDLLKGLNERTSHTGELAMLSDEEMGG